MQNRTIFAQRGNRDTVGRRPMKWRPMRTDEESPPGRWSRAHVLRDKSACARCNRRL
ncbi:MAG TPA: hypothetical protein VH593_12475 [Ktedonobacteraceae bacterium]